MRLDGKLTAYGSLPAALREAMAGSAGGGLIAPMYLLQTLFPDSRWIVAGSEEHSGHGEFRGRPGHYVLTIHYGRDGNGLLTPATLTDALHLHREHAFTPTYGLDLGRIYGPDVFTRLLRGDMPDASRIPIYTYDELCRGDTPTDLRRHAVVRELCLAQRTFCGYQPIEGNLLDGSGQVADSQIIVYAGGRERARQLVGRARAADDRLGVWHPFNSTAFERDRAQGRILVMANHDYGTGLNGYAVLAAPMRRRLAYVPPERLERTVAPGCGSEYLLRI